MATRYFRDTTTPVECERAVATGTGEVPVTAGGMAPVLDPPDRIDRVERTDESDPEPASLAGETGSRRVVD